jgi:hypothetical protein
MTLGPKQRIWVDALRSGEYKQGDGCLFDPETQSYCCLGVANCVLELGEGDEHVLEYTYQQLGLRGQSGAIVGLSLEAFKELHDLPAGYDPTFTIELTALNDRGWSFSKIADLIEQHPHWVFERSV